MLNGWDDKSAIKISDDAQDARPKEAKKRTIDKGTKTEAMGTVNR